MHITISIQYCTRTNKWELILYIYAVTTAYNPNSNTDISMGEYGTFSILYTPVVVYTVQPPLNGSVFKTKLPNQYTHLSRVVYAVYKSQ